MSIGMVAHMSVRVLFIVLACISNTVNRKLGFFQQKCSQVCAVRQLYLLRIDYFFEIYKNKKLKAELCIYIFRLYCFQVHVYLLVSIS